MKLRKCPACRARVRSPEVTSCRRCGADLHILQTLIARAQHLQTYAQQALTQGHHTIAIAYALAALQLYDDIATRQTLSACLFDAGSPSLAQAILEQSND